MKHHFLAFAVAALSFTACSNEDNISQDYLANTPIKLNVSVDEPTTRAGYSNAELPEGFWLFVTQDQENVNSKYNYQVYVKKDGDSWKTYKLDQETWNITNEEVTMLWANMNNNDATIYAANEIKENFSTTEDQSTENNFKGADFLFMPFTTVKPSTDGISVDFKHTMSKINLTIELGSEYEFSKDVDLKITDVKIDGSLVSGDLASGGINNVYGDPTPITPLHTSATAFSKDADGNITKASATYEAILIPQTIESGKFTVSFKVDGKLYEWVYNNEAGLTLAPNTAYTLKLIAGDDKVQPASFSVAAWNPGNGDGENKETD